MEIIHEENYVEMLDNLKVGDVFEWDYDKNIYMKIRPYTTTCDEPNVVNLKDGNPRYINTDKYVVPVRAKLIIAYGKEDEED